MSGEHWEIVLAAGTAFASAPAALFWFYASALPLPPPPRTWNAPLPENDTFYQSLLASARWNKRAAAWSGVAALCACVAAIVHVVRVGSPPQRNPISARPLRSSRRQDGPIARRFGAGPLLAEALLASAWPVDAESMFHQNALRCLFVIE